MKEINDNDEQKILDQLFFGKEYGDNGDEDFQFLEDIISTIHEEGFKEERKEMEVIQKRVQRRRWLKRTIYIIVGVLILGSFAYFMFPKDKEAEKIFAALEKNLKIDQELEGAIILKKETYRGSTTDNSDEELLQDLDSFIDGINSFKAKDYQESISSMSLIQSDKVKNKAQYINVLSLVKLNQQDEAKKQLEQLLSSSYEWKQKFKENALIQEWLEETK